MLLLYFKHKVLNRTLIAFFFLLKCQRSTYFFQTIPVFSLSHSLTLIQSFFTRSTEAKNKTKNFIPFNSVQSFYQSAVCWQRVKEHVRGGAPVLRSHFEKSHKLHVNSTIFLVSDPLRCFGLVVLEGEEGSTTR